MSTASLHMPTIGEGPGRRQRHICDLAHICKTPHQQGARAVVTGASISEVPLVAELIAAALDNVVLVKE